jgi:hypothetical protein
MSLDTESSVMITRADIIERTDVAVCLAGNLPYLEEHHRLGYNAM